MEIKLICQVQTDDIEILATIRYTAILTLATQKMGADAAHEWANSAKPDRIQHALEAHYIWVATIASEAVGWVEVNGNRLEGMYVHPSQAQQGIGAALLAHAENQIRAANHTSVALEASSNAESFYKKHGCQATGNRSPELGLPMMKQF